MALSIMAKYHLNHCSLHFVQLWFSVNFFSLLQTETSLMMDNSYTSVKNVVENYVGLLNCQL